MDRTHQRTLAREVTLEGTGVHSGEAATLTVGPAPPGSGIVFRRDDLEDRPEIPAILDNVVDTKLGTSLGRGEVRILTVEHVMAALAARGIDNALVTLTGPEPPIRDGSFRDYTALLGDAGVDQQDEPARVIEVKKPITVQEGGGESYVATPGDSYRIAATIDFDHPAIGRQFGSFRLDTETFEKEIAPARTFGFRADAEDLQAQGLALGASQENTVVLDEQGVMSDDLRFSDEFLRHKIGDMVGDLSLLGARLVAHIVAERPSHHGNVALARAIAGAHRRGGDEPILDAASILEHLPHRYPMLLVDRIIDFEPEKRIVGIKNVTINEPFFQGHYPGHPIMPGVLIIEAMAQVGGLLLIDAVENPGNCLVYFMSLNNVKWRRPVTPGDQIVFTLEMINFRRHTCKMKGYGHVDGQLVAEAELLARVVDKTADDES